MKLAGQRRTVVYNAMAGLHGFPCRKYWEEESGKKGDSFDVESVIGHGAEHAMLRERAEVLYDTLFGAPRVEVARWWLPEGAVSCECVCIAGCQCEYFKSCLRSSAACSQTSECTWH